MDFGRLFNLNLLPVFLYLALNDVLYLNDLKNGKFNIDLNNNIEIIKMADTRQSTKGEIRLLKFRCQRAADKIHHSRISM